MNIVPEKEIEISQFKEVKEDVEDEEVKEDELPMSNQEIILSEEGKNLKEFEEEEHIIMETNEEDHQIKEMVVEAKSNSYSGEEEDNYV